MIFNLIKKTKVRLSRNKKQISRKKFEKFKCEFKKFYDFANLKLENYNLNDWNITFDYAKRRAGACLYSTKELSFSVYFLRNSSSSHINDTLLHEIAHALVGPNQGHNDRWKKKALSIGCSGQVYHTFNFSVPSWIKYCSNNCWEQKSYRRKRNLICKICRSEVLYKKNYVSSSSTNVPDKSLG
tara:strand:- start:526 stop:1077 length:552 start_codon:yes stop_codon:yes gene_type:complete